MLFEKKKHLFTKMFDINLKIEEKFFLFKKN